MAGNVEKAGREYNCNFEGNLRPNYTPLCPKMEKKMQIQGQIKRLLDEFA
jgi:hypothetical protein